MHCAYPFCSVLNPSGDVCCECFSVRCELNGLEELLPVGRVRVGREAIFVHHQAVAGGVEGRRGRGEGEGGGAEGGGEGGGEAREQVGGGGASGMGIPSCCIPLFFLFLPFVMFVVLFVQ